jgi:hypothetical protein
MAAALSAQAVGAISKQVAVAIERVMERMFMMSPG